ncbi:ATP-binding protein [Pseudoalteromonas simplex]|uniref:ATP-binding protein n=1 Tax=Pseudoalteromonas simplex TaxID=2783613 RepID=UPI001886BDF5|nr:ATP-binding protein [Pseudoalteromonas sp. A520]
MLNIFSKSIAAKMSLALLLLLLALSASFFVMDKRLKTIETAFVEISRISNYAVSILRINKDIVEMQRDISVYGNSGSKSVFNKIEDNFQSIKKRLGNINFNQNEANSQVYLDSMSELLSRYDENLAVLTKRYEVRAHLTYQVLPSIYTNAIAELETLKSKSINTEDKLSIAELTNLWHSMHHDAYQFLSKKDYSKRAKVNTTLRLLNQKLQVLQGPAITLDKMSQFTANYQQQFSKSIQANRHYLSLVNVVMAGDAIEFSTLSNQLRELSLSRLKQIKSEAEKTVSNSERILKLLAIGVVIYIVAFAIAFHLQISHAIKRLTVSFKYFLSGDLSAKIYDLNRKDEIGVLANAAERFRVLSKDLADAKQSAERTAKVKSEFLANMSHEIRTPMNGVLGMARQLSRTPLSAEQAKMLNIIKSSGASLLVIINDILDLSKIEAAKVELESGPIELNSLLNELTHLFSQQAENKGIELFITTTPELTDFIFLGDETRLKQVLINLLGNAIKFTHRGSVLLNVIIEEVVNDEFKVTFSVSDTGIGIANEQLDSLFDAFSQADASITRRFGGTGLGLTISSKLLHLMSSSLKVESEPDKGSMFYFELNVTRTFITPAISENLLEESSEKSVDFSHVTALVVEDNDINQVVIESMLAEFNIKSISLADDGEQAIAQCEIGAFDIIFMDMQMPVLGGPEATLKIRKLPAYKHTPIVALTANVLAADKQRCFEAGMNDFIGKPIKFENLKRVLVKWCSQHH